MKCPRCNKKLEKIYKDKIELDVCRYCGGMWLDHGELEKLIHHGKKK